MLIKISESNMWEREKWTYILDVEKQGGAVINYLMIFVRLANEQFKKDMDAAGSSPVFASSRYFIEFFDSLETATGKNPVLINKNMRLILNGKGSYKEGGIYLDKRISLARMKSAMISMRDKKENKIYKSFESLFLK